MSSIAWNGLFVLISLAGCNGPVHVDHSAVCPSEEYVPAGSQVAADEVCPAETCRMRCSATTCDGEAEAEYCEDCEALRTWLDEECSGCDVRDDDGVVEPWCGEWGTR